jgi:hypothetical protein
MAEKDEFGARGETTSVEANIVEKSALEIMERSMIDVQIATAKQYPRNIQRFQATAKALATIDRETAESCVYSRPVGKDERGRPVFAKGESIRLAEIVAASYGNLRVQGMVVEVTPKYVKAVGVAHDLETNYAAKAEVVESTLTSKGYPMSERMRIVIAKAAQSKAMRDAIFRVVPKGLCKSIVAEANAVIFGSNKSMSERRAMVDAWVKKLPIDPKRIWNALGVQCLEEITEDELELLTGIRTAMKDGDTTLDEAFPPLEGDDDGQKGSAGLKAKLKGKDAAGGNTAAPAAPAEPVDDDPFK